MKLGTYICFGLGMAAGALVMHNCKKVRKTVADAQDAVVEKIESKKQEIFEYGMEPESAGDGN